MNTTFESLKRNYASYLKVMAMTDKANIVISFDKSYEILSIVFLICNVRYAAIATYQDGYTRKVEVALETSIGNYLRSELINVSYIDSVYKINPTCGEFAVLYYREKVSMSLSDVEKELELAPGCLTIINN